MGRSVGLAQLRGYPRLAVAGIVAMALVAVAVPDVAAEPGAARSASADPTKTSPKTYIVQMAADPVATYDGGVADYAEYLESRHDAVLTRAGGRKLYDYAYSFNGFAAKLTRDEALAVTNAPGVVSVTKDRLYKVDTSSTPSFLGLDAPGGLWDQLGGPTGGERHRGAGENIVIADIDSGIWPSSRSFTDRDGRGKLTYGPLHGFRGSCDSARTVGDDSWDANLCNRKLVAARHFDSGWGGDEGVAEQMPWEFLSPRDYNGHGTHTASTAGGNHGVVPTNAESLGPIGGIAPRARIAVYKALWSTENGLRANGYESDLIAAIDQAVADDVDVINYSVSGTSTDFLDPIEIAYLQAAEAGIFVAAAGGNSGPASRTVAHPSPWLTTVAAGTHDRSARGAVTLGNGKRYTGASVAHAVGPAPLIAAGDAVADGAQEWQAELCYPASANDGQPVLDPAKVAGKIVVCDEGNVAPWAKSRAVQDAGGVGMVLTHIFDSPVTAYVHLVPAVDVATSDRDAIRAYAATAGATATIEAATIARDVAAPHTASFSSRGPLVAGGGDLLKPDLIAPGDGILAAVSPAGNSGLTYNLLSGTSMATPHVAGIAALLKQRHPSWSPMAIKSALMTTGSDVLDGPGTDPGVIFSEGAGHVAPNSAVHPGLVYDSDESDWTAFLCGTTDGVDQRVCDRLSRSVTPSSRPTSTSRRSRLVGCPARAPSPVRSPMSSPRLRRTQPTSKVSTASTCGSIRGD